MAYASADAFQGASFRQKSHPEVAWWWGADATQAVASASVVLAPVGMTAENSGPFADCRIDGQAPTCGFNAVAHAGESVGVRAG